ncbi:MAG TPA: 7-cyano-7-deazaguanine synthase [Nitrososphaera sp.]|jgi:7-cyano-7-deazaguanine synthase|nr:7-cyano-7-deazaguanine synthase [uncultured Nitrososphaera sp.]HEU4985386.1 7-cyano-7-deazaguanine synthase [Nitrososphaera sp.]
MDKALVMLSGGLDSATCLYWARERFAVSAITFNYFGRLVQEKRATRSLAEKAGVEVIEVDVPFVKEASDFDDGKMKKEKGSDLRWASYVPARNMMFYSIAAHYAEYLNAKWIIGGHNSHDVSFFKDASRQYIEKMNSLFAESCLLCDGRPYQIVLPLAEMDRKAVITLARGLHVPIEMTWSCHQEGEIPCRECYACRQRLEAFSALGIRDPALKK